MSLFLLTFFLIYGGTHLYFFLKVKEAVSLGTLSGLCLAFFLLLMVFAPVLVRIMEKQGLEASARLTAYTGYLWMGFLFLFLSASLAIDIYHGLLHGVGFLSHRDFASFFLSKRVALALPIAWGIVTAVYGYFEALDIKTERLVIATSKIPETVGKLTIVQISDVHLGLIVRKERLSRIIDKVKAASPDILVSTGDLVDGEINRMTGLAELLDDIKPRYGKYAVTGNHEIYAGIKQTLTFTEQAGFRMLRNEGVVAAGVINIVGIDDPVIERVSHESPVSERALLEGLPHEKFTLFLKHRPAIEQKSLGLFNLQLSGHVHKGQLFPFNMLTHLFYPVKMGYSIYPQNSALYVSRGTGTWGPPIRFLAPPEVTVIELKHGDKVE
ncbi:MAG TPA: metallophosphoesterase [Geobacteraceae bacterium]|nr:metallophosphoesterase [Geobacteraceae bacterium]